MQSDPIIIRRQTQQDAAALARILGDMDVLHNLMQLPYTSEEVWKARLAEPAKPGSNDLSLVAERSGRVVGSAGLFSPGLQVRRRHVSTLGISVAREAQGQGVGTALMQSLCDYADRWAQILRIELTVFADNAHAVALYERFGFEHEGRHRGYALRDGVYVDVFSMARLHPAQPVIR
jgi:L-phenylalanine/L-methionine N-acetyltransferase